MWLPAIPVYTEWISQPAINSASSTARWMDCTVDSMLTTTPFFSPRDGCDPIPMISISSFSVTSHTIATTFEVPISSPTIRSFPSLFGIYALSPVFFVPGLPAAPFPDRRHFTAKPLE
jgi:hypothetical protein